VSVVGMRRPSIAAAGVRSAIEFGPMAFGVVLEMALEPLGSLAANIAGGVAALGLVFGIGELLRASLRTPDKRALWDRAAGTMVRYRAVTS